MMKFNQEDKILYDIDNMDGHIQVVEKNWNGQDAYVLLVNDYMQSAMYKEEDNKNELLFPYMEKFSYAMAMDPAIQKTLMIGGGGFAYPRYYLDRYPDKQITVIENSKTVIETAEKYFGLDALRKNERFHLIQADGMEYLKQSKDKYNLIINDAFSGNIEEERDQEMLQLISAHLSDDGFYILNEISSIKGFHTKNLKNTIKDMKKYFLFTKYIQAEDIFQFKKQNIVVISSNRELQ